MDRPMLQLSTGESSFKNIDTLSTLVNEVTGRLFGSIQLYVELHYRIVTR